MTTLRFGRYSVALSNTEKVLFRDAGITKGDLITYYRNVADWMLPHLRDRPLSLHRFPDGIEAAGFYQQQAAEYFPDWIATCPTPRAEDGGSQEPVRHVLCNNQATLAYLANQATIGLHGWLARAPAIRTPDRLIFDLDPSGDDFDEVKHAARAVVDLMHRLGMNPYAMTTGSRGLHVVAPLRPQADFDTVRDLARSMASHLADGDPDRLTVEQRRNRRGGRVYLDIMRNAYGQTAVLPYSVRPRRGAPVATPLALTELDRAKLRPDGWNVGNILPRLERTGDPWAGMQRRATAPATAHRKLAKLTRG